MSAHIAAHLRKDPSTLSAEELHRCLLDSREPLSAVVDDMGFPPHRLEQILDDLFVEGSGNAFRFGYYSSSAAAIDVYICPAAMPSVEPSHPSARYLGEFQRGTVATVEASIGNPRDDKGTTVLAECVIRWFAWAYDGIASDWDGDLYAVDDSLFRRGMPADRVAAPAAPARRPIATPSHQPKPVAASPAKATPKASPLAAAVRDRSEFVAADPIRRKPPPVDCPRCQKPLYHSAATRPKPKLSLLGMLLLAGGCLATTAIYLGIAAYMRFVMGMTIRAGMVASLIWLPVALIPGLVLAWVAYKLPKRVSLRCVRCGWKETFKWG